MKFQTIIASAFLVTMSAPLIFVSAWAGPPATAPDSNVSAPLNVSTLSQTKSGALSIGGVLDAASLAVWGGTVLNYNQPTIYLQDSDAKSGMIQVNDGWMYFLSGCGTGSLTWCENSGRWPMQINLANNATYFGGQVVVNEGATPAQELAISHNGIWKTVTSGDEKLYFQYSCDGCDVQIGDGAGAPNDLIVKGTTTASAFIYSSDRRLKDRIVTLRENLAKLLKLRPVSFTWSGGLRKGQGDIGFIAQEVEEVLPVIVSADNEGYKAVDYPRIVPILVGAIQEQQQQIAELKREIEALKGR